MSRCLPVLAAVLLLAPVGRASACGGFMCRGGGNPAVVQAAERIVFAQGEGGEVTAIIQILYQGPADEFAWLLPVDGQPEIEVSSDQAFTALQRATNPQYALQQSQEGTCRSWTGGGVGCRSVLALSPPTIDRVEGGGMGDFAPEPIDVLDAGTVGPYDFVILSVADGVEDPTEETRAWLVDNGFDVSELGVERLRSYLESGMNLLAFRLTKNASAGSIRPVRLSFGSGVPSIPIRPTAAAAADDMGVMVWVLGDARAIPANYASLELNEAAINWFSPGATYDDVVTRAANEAGGQGFVTEMAGDAEPLADAIWSAEQRNELRALEAMDWGDDLQGAFTRVVGTYRGFDGIGDAVTRWVVLDDGETLDDVIRSPANATLIEGFDADLFLADVRAEVIEPMERTADLFADHPWVTRLYTTMSADEMTLDPAFDFNPDLPTTSNLHTADMIVECDPTTWRFDAPWRVELANGEVIRGRRGGWPFQLDDEDPMPATTIARRIGTRGSGEVALDNRDAVHERIVAQNRTISSPNGVLSVGSSVVPAAAEVAIMRAAQIPSALMLGLAALALSLRRRRR